MRNHAYFTLNKYALSVFRGLRQHSSPSQELALLPIIFFRPLFVFAPVFLFSSLFICVCCALLIYSLHVTVLTDCLQQEEQEETRLIEQSKLYVEGTGLAQSHSFLSLISLFSIKVFDRITRRSTNTMQRLSKSRRISTAIQWRQRHYYPRFSLVERRTPLVRFLFSHDWWFRTVTIFSVENQDSIENHICSASPSDYLTSTRTSLRSGASSQSTNATNDHSNSHRETQADDFFHPRLEEKQCQTEPMDVQHQS